MISTKPLILALALTACGNEREQFSYGVPHVDLELSSENLARLNSTVFDKVDYPGFMRVDGGREKSVRIAYAGRTTIDAYKKSFDVDGERLSAQPTDPRALNARLGFELFRRLGFPSPTITPATVALNGRLLGLYERIGGVEPKAALSLYRARHSNRDLDADAITDLSALFKTYRGEAHPGDLIALIESVNGSGDVAEVLDLRSFYRYVALAVILDHWDGFDNNYVLYREHDSRHLRLAPWDLERLLEGGVAIDPYGQGALCRRILADPARAAAYRVEARAVLEEVRAVPYARLVRGWAAEMRLAYEADAVLSAPGVPLAERAEDLVRRLDERLAHLAGAW